MFKKEVKASVTVECSLALPVYIVSVLALFSCMLVLSTYSMVNVSLHEAVKETAYGAYPTGILADGEEYEGMLQELAGTVVPEVYVEGRLISLMGSEGYKSSSLRGSLPMFNILRSNPDDKNDMMDFVITYRADPWFIPGRGIKLENRCRMRKWTGYSPPSFDSQEEYVYITSNGKVYHTNYDCTYLHPSIRSCDIGELESVRNKSGSKYTQCAKCGKKPQGDTVYITDWGEKYHNSISCYELKRNIKEIPISQVGERSLCEKCAGYRKGQ